MDRKKAIEYIKWYFTEDDGIAADAKVKEAIQALVPELKESEDERIRKVLVSIVKWLGFDSSFFIDNSVTKNEVLAYLEKQKEPSMSAEEVLIKAGLKPYKDGNKWCILAGDNIQEGICGFGDTIDEALYQFLMEVCDKQKEQKPADDEVKAIAYREYERGRESGLRDGQKHVLDNAESYGLCKPAEWSEEEIVNWLKENFYVSSFDNTKIVTKFSSMDDLIKGFHKRFKSLLSRPKPSGNWKPSKYLLSLVKKVADGEMLTGVEQMAMGTLHEELKKLSI